jgi:hypothetical protein
MVDPTMTTFAEGIGFFVCRSNTLPVMEANVGLFCAIPLVKSVMLNVRMAKNLLCDMFSNLRDFCVFV